jgi:mannose-6-phosphate isomerase-like protein (cupin superfamily)
MSNYKIVKADNVFDHYADSDVPGEFRRLTPELDSEQLAITLIRIPAHCDFEQSTGHYHNEIEEIYIITKGELTMRFDDSIEKVGAGSVVRVAPKTTRSHRNEGDKLVEMWAISKKLDHRDATKVDGFWPPSDLAKQTKS